ncbi:JAB domain-containing protein [Arcicella sp. LKC2W]|uniref:JAB domain-containing protein n=1 Tax=Arcicella sp. LKC2W TaxID=2984198 RepID=UPI002B2028D8|nr:JAB domain-containing protein [Arcicella sp. LKC2W]MEA5459110.1 JAB domain-containing protein [Arcicella sp. LKC2W]
MKKLIIPEIEISLQYKNNVKQSELFTIETVEDCEIVLRQIFDSSTFLWREELLLLCVNCANKVVGSYKISVGGINSTICDPKVIFTIALNAGATGIILAHNHPSGNRTPSPADKETTKRVQKIGELLNIKLIEHMILTQEDYYSFSVNGLLNNF